MKKFLLVIALVAVCATVAQAGRTDISCSGTLTIRATNAAWVGGHGWSSGSTRTISWSGSCNMCQWGIGIYGWGTNPLVEYYIGRSGGSNAGTYNTSKGTFTLYTNNCNGPNITGSGSFQQYNCSGNGGSGQNMGEHNSGWSSRGKGTNIGGGYQLVGGEHYGGGSGITLTFIFLYPHSFPRFDRRRGMGLRRTGCFVRTMRGWTRRSGATESTDLSRCAPSPTGSSAGSAPPCPT